jgi:diacylglycerol kinase (ATP)
MSEDHETLQTFRSPKPVSQPGTSVPPFLKSGKTLRLGLISNPLSGGNREGLHAIREAMTGRPRTYHLEVRTPLEVTSALAELAKKEVEVVAVNGGDGTIHAVLTELFSRPSRGPVPVLALLRSGTASMIARDVGLNGSRRRALSRLLTWMSTDDGCPAVVERSILKVERAPDREPLYGMFFGAAGICQGIQFCLDRVHTKGMSGQLAAGVTLGRFLLAAARGDKRLLCPELAIVGLDNEPSEQREYLLILISTLERLFLGLRPYWGNETAPLYYTALGSRPGHLLRALPSLLRGRTGRFGRPEHGYFSRKVQKARLTLTGGFTLDGELYLLDNTATQITITEGGKASFLKL